QRIGRTDELAAAVDDVLSFDRHRDQRSAGDKAYEIPEERFIFMLVVVPSRAFAVELHQLHRRNNVAAPLDARHDFTDQTARNGVRLAENQRSFDSHRTAQYHPPNAFASMEDSGPYAGVAKELSGSAFSSIRYVAETASTNADASALL